MSVTVPRAAYLALGVTLLLAYILGGALSPDIYRATEPFYVLLPVAAAFSIAAAAHGAGAPRLFAVARSVTGRIRLFVGCADAVVAALLRRRGSRHIRVRCGHLVDSVLRSVSSSL